MESNNQSMSNNVCFNYRLCIDLGRKYSLNNEFSLGDFFLFLALLCPNIDILSLLEAMSLRAYIYFSLNDETILLVLSMKTLRLFPQLIQLDDSNIFSDVIKILNRTCVIMNKQNKRNTILPFYIISKAKQLIQSNNNVKLDEKDRLLFERTYDLCEQAHLKSLITIKRTFSNIIDSNTNQFLEDKRNELYQILEEHIDKIDFDKQGSCIKPGEECYLISNKWLKRYTKYLDKMLNIKDSPEDYANYVNTAFDIDIQCDYFDQTQQSDEEDNVSIGSVNNFWIAKYKEQWLVPENDYTNDFIKSSLRDEEYSIVNKDQWDELTEDFDYINTIKRYKLSTGEIEIQLKEISVMILDKELFKKHPTLIYPRRIQLSKEKDTCESLLKKIYSILKYPIPVNFNIYEIGIYKMNKDQRKMFLLELMIAYSMTGSSIKIKEIKDSSKDNSPFIQLKNDHTQMECSTCSSMNNLSKCTECNTHVLNLSYYCSYECQLEDKQHKGYHKNVSEFIYIQRSIAELKDISLESIYRKYPKSTHGLVGFRNLGNTCFLNSALQCLSHCEELTKYFLLKQYKVDLNINNTNGTSGEIAKAYYKLIKQLWLGHQSILCPTEFKGIFTNFVKQFADYNQHDSQEVLTFILDKIHEDLNKINKKPYIEMNNHNSTETDKVASARWWKQYRKRESSIIVDLFHGQFKNKITCAVCHNISITFDPFMFVSLPIPTQSYILHFKFFPVITKNKKSKNKKKKRKKQATIQFSFKSYKLSYSEKISMNDFINIIIKDNSDLQSSKCNFDFVLLKPNREFHKMIYDGQELSDSFGDLLNGYEMIIYEKQDPRVNIYVYPCAFVSQKRYYIIPDKSILFLSYPLAIPMENGEKVKDLYIKINTFFNVLYPKNDNNSMDNVTSLNKEEREYSESFRLYIYNTKGKKVHWVSPSYWYNYFMSPSGNDDMCDFCGTQCTYCRFLNRFSQNETMKYILSHCSRNSPLVLYAELESYNMTNRDDGINLIPFAKQSGLVTFNKTVSIYDCLNLFTSEEYLDDDNKWYCPKCKKHQEATKKMDIYTLPPYLIIQLKRFRNKTGYSFSYGRKNFTFIDFPIDSLDLSKYIPNPNESNASYDLIGISEHYGQLSSGHYTAICKNNNKWYEYDDCSVSLKNKSDIVNNSAYILFYKQK